jgi:hypothetical protein
LLGASSRFVYQRIAEYGDGWFPIYQDQRRAGVSGAVDYAAGIAQTREAWVEAGREGEPSFSIFGVGPDTGAVESLMNMGFDRVIFALPSGPADEVLPMVEKYAALAHSLQS